LSDAASLVPHMVQGRALRLAGIGRSVPVARARTQIPVIWTELMSIRLPDQIGGVGYGIRGTVTSDGRFAYIAAIELAGRSPLPPNLVAVELPRATYAVFSGFGHVSELRRAWPILVEQWLPGSGMQLAATPSFESYGEDFDPLLGYGEMAIWLAVLPGGR
jgi:predicted transcriptional regulator YdeE